MSIRKTLAAAAALVALAPLPAAAQVPEPPTACPESDPGYVVSKCARWLSVDAADQAFGSGVSPDGATTYSLGYEYAWGTAALVAHDATTGAVRWRSTLTDVVPRDLAVAPDGTLYVTGFSDAPGFAKLATVAIDPANGSRRWTQLFQSEWAHGDHGYEVEVAPDSQTVYVGGSSYHVNPDGSGDRSDDFRVVAYSAAGSQLWTRSMDSVENQFGKGDWVEALAVSPDGEHVVAAGRWGSANGFNYGTFSLDAATGATEWFDRYTGGVERWDLVNDVAFSPDSSRVFVTGDSYGGFGYQRATVGYDVATGARAWVARFVGSANWTDFGKAIAVSPDGEVVYVTGESVGSPVPRVVPTAPGVGLTADMSTQALDADTGAQIWEARYSVPRGSVSDDVVVSPDGSRVYVAGRTWTFTTGWNIVTVAYETSLGLEQWVARYTNKDALLGSQDDWDPLMTIAPDGGRVYVTGTAKGTSAMVTLAYDTGELAD